MIWSGAESTLKKSGKVTSSSSRILNLICIENPVTELRRHKAEEVSEVTRTEHIGPV